MKRTRPKPRTAAQQERFNQLKRLGCLIARLRGEGFVPCEIHHLTKLGKRDHDKTIGLSPWRHRGQLPPGYTTTLATQIFGPSFAKGSRKFAEAYGTDRQLLAVQNYVLEQVAKGQTVTFPAVTNIRAHVEEIALACSAAASPVTVRMIKTKPENRELRRHSIAVPSRAVGKTFNAARADRKPVARCSKVLPPRAANWKPKP